jgi:hypothetical protein
LAVPRRILVSTCLVLIAAGCGGSSARRVDAGTAYACLQGRPQYRLSGVSQDARLTYLSIAAPARPTGSPHGLQAAFQLIFTQAIVPDPRLLLADLRFFSTATAARKWRDGLVSAAGGTGSIAERAVQRDRNVVIVWANGEEVPPDAAEAIIRGCLRPRRA